MTECGTIKVGKPRCGFLYEYNEETDECELSKAKVAAVGGVVALATVSGVMMSK